MRDVDSSPPQTRSHASEDKRFEALYREFYGRVLAYALRRAAPEAAHDVVADTFLVAWRRLDHLPDEPLPWLFGVARKTLANHRRAGRRRDALLTRLKAVETVRLGGEAAPTLRLVDIAEAIERLPDNDQELLELIAWDGLTVGEAATALGIASATCRVRLYRARRRLAAELGRGEEVRPFRKAGRFPETAKEQ